MSVTSVFLLEKAAGHQRDRAATYDKPEGERSMGRTVMAFNAITGKDLSEAEGWLLMSLLKKVRLFTRPGYHADSAEDSVSYDALMGEAKSCEVVEQVGAARAANAQDAGPGWSDWVEHKPQRGNICRPVALEASSRIRVRFRCGEESKTALLAGDVPWGHADQASALDVVAFCRRLS